MSPMNKPKPKTLYKVCAYRLNGQWSSDMRCGYSIAVKVSRSTAYKYRKLFSSAGTGLYHYRVVPA